MSESILPAILLLAIGLGVVRGGMLHARGFVPRGRKYEAPAALPAREAIASERFRIRRPRRSLRAVPSSAQSGIAR